jgi:hypothetical protein
MTCHFNQTPGAPPAIVAQIFMLQSIPIEIKTLLSIRNVCKDLSRQAWFVAVSEARLQRGLGMLSPIWTAFIGNCRRVDIIMVEIELTDKYDPETGYVLIDPAGTYRINIRDYLK